LAVLDLRGDAGIVTVYDGPGYEWGASYSPTGEHILFSSDADGRDQLYVFDGEAAVPLTENGGYPGAWVGS
jgi:Tol biopolymer transport system component